MTESETRAVVDELKRLCAFVRIPARETPGNDYEAGIKAAYTDFALALNARAQELLETIKPKETGVH